MIFATSAEIYVRMTVSLVSSSLISLLATERTFASAVFTSAFRDARSKYAATTVAANRTATTSNPTIISSPERKRHSPHCQIGVTGLLLQKERPRLLGSLDLHSTFRRTPI